MAWTDLPDGYKITMIIGQDELGNPVVLKVGGAGELIAVMKGETALGVLKSLRTDADGQIITILKGASGVEVGVDADGFLSAVMKGAYSGNPVTVAVDADGNIIGIFKGNYGGALKTMAVDADGRILAGQPYSTSAYAHSQQVVAQGTRGTLVSVSGIGFCDWIHFYVAAHASSHLVTVEVYCDGETSDYLAFGFQPHELYQWALTAVSQPVALQMYAEDGLCNVFITKRFDFKESFILKVLAPGGAGDQTVDGTAMYTKII